jgi:aminopeptidase-like protein
VSAVPSDRPTGIDSSWIDRLLEDLFPFCRSITGNGNRSTLARVAKEIDLTVHEVPTGTPVLDWQVPLEWNLERGRLWGPAGDLIADSDNCNLHVVSYSQPVRGQRSLPQIAPHLHSNPEMPWAVPYRTAYYAQTWGFCLPYEDHASFQPGLYNVEIDATLEPGALTYGELVVPGTTDAEVLISTHICHPSMANDNLTGIAAAAALARWAGAAERRLTYRFVFVPGTIGSITWLALHREVVPRIRHGLVLTGLGDPGRLTYKRSRRGDTGTDRVMARVLGERGNSIDWYPYGYDERQYCSLGFDLPIGRLSRTMHGTYPEYHTSADDLSFVSSERVLEAVDVIIEALAYFDDRQPLRNLAPEGEPQLGRRGLFAKIGGALGNTSKESTYLWLLSLADGDTDEADVAARSGLPVDEVTLAASRLRDAGLLNAD